MCGTLRNCRRFKARGGKIEIWFFTAEALRMQRNSIPTMELLVSPQIRGGVIGKVPIPPTEWYRVPAPRCYELVADTSLGHGVRRKVPNQPTHKAIHTELWNGYRTPAPNDFTALLPNLPTTTFAVILAHSKSHADCEVRLFKVRVDYKRCKDGERERLRDRNGL